MNGACTWLTWDRLVIGYHIPNQIRERSAEIDWIKIVALRNILVHGYFGIDDDILWDVIQNRIPPLRSAIQRLEDSTG